MLGKIEEQEEKGTTEDEMIRWHHRLNGHQFEQAPGDGEGQGSLAFCSRWDCKESDMTEQLNNNCPYMWVYFWALYSVPLVYVSVLW